MNLKKSKKQKNGIIRLKKLVKETKNSKTGVKKERE